MNINRPLTLIAELTYRCPLRCPYCSNPVNYGESNYRQELATQYWLDAIGQAAKLGILQLGFTGGEPLLRKDLEVMVETAASTGMYTSLITSGKSLTPERAAKLKDCGLDHIQISIQDSQADKSDYIAGVTSFEQKLTAARLVKKLGFPLTINVVLHRHNLDRIAEILELCKTLEADRVELANTQYYGWALENRTSLLPTPAQLEKAKKATAIAVEKRYFPMGLVYVLPDYYEQYPKPCMGGWGQKTIVISPSGDVLPCQVATSIPELNFANISERTLEWIWFESEAFNRFRGTDWMEEPCRSCSRREIDFGGCRCQAFLLTGKSNATDPVCHLSPEHNLINEIREKQDSNYSQFTYRSI
ncbi:coenzyme PQQ biosynthesis protein E [Rivularia sp. PCC 7116]|uniref:pyrroloquinoline quinone biosynthesis protein PqqE n=1 Tax=Rivularia sp. PCC 7116 TaxID=373994 RepID=UPI00029F2D98|nr:pyrroloquinoline quinone biosynthesis protein PqqE [Rivularia sp. PCC 7116]AFY58685.1 coenzyme PQQ biosynthesis protein E [Rivularia sp. PCC 7116]